MPKLFVNMTSEQANLCAVVLSSAGIPYFTAEGGDGWEIWVKDADVERALAAIKRYFRENPDAGADRNTASGAAGTAGADVDRNLGGPAAGRRIRCRRGLPGDPAFR